MDHNLTPFKSFLPLAGNMLTYLEAMRNPKKQHVNTFAIGKTAILIDSISDSPLDEADKSLPKLIFQSRFTTLSNSIQEK